MGSGSPPLLQLERDPNLYFHLPNFASDYRIPLQDRDRDRDRDRGADPEHSDRDPDHSLVLKLDSDPNLFLRLPTSS